MNGRRENSTQEKNRPEKLHPPALPNRRRAGPDCLSLGRVPAPTTHHHMLPRWPLSGIRVGLAPDSAGTSTEHLQRSKLENRADRLPHALGGAPAL